MANAEARARAKRSRPTPMDFQRVHENAAPRSRIVVWTGTRAERWGHQAVLRADRQCSVDAMRELLVGASLPPITAT
eukprot:12725182-Alexandrium_andersonii.AAC.1